MIRSLAALIATLAASPAMAHAGPHLHPHGGEALLVALLLIGAAALIWRRSK